MNTPSYFTVQMSDNAMGGGHCIHLGRVTDAGGLGDNVCGSSRHGRDAEGRRYGFSVSGGSTDPNAFSCGGCMATLNSNRGPVRGIFAHLFVPLPKHRRNVERITDFDAHRRSAHRAEPTS